MPALEGAPAWASELALAYESGASPVVILNKSDLADHLAEDMDEIRALTVGIPVHAMSAKENSGLEVIIGYLGPGKTGALLGRSRLRDATRCSKTQ